MSTRKIVSFVVAMAFATVAAAPAFAVTVSRADGQPMNPNGEPFSATGPTTLTKGIGLNCTATFNGTITTTGIVQITSATFAAGSALCGSISAVTPWSGQADTTTQLTINNVQVNTPLGACGPSKVATAFSSANSSLTFNNSQLSGGCSVSGTVNTSPKFVVQ